MADQFIIGNTLDLGIIKRVLEGQIKTIKLSEASKAEIIKAHAYIINKVADSKDLFYGINTGFGSLCNVAIEDDHIEELQFNLVRSHACGMGDRLADNMVRLILFLKIVNLSQGYSGVSLALIEQMISLYNHGIYAHIYELGSLGASGDLAPLAHLALSLIGEGKVSYQGKDMLAEEALAICGLEKHNLQVKEGLALLNGTQFSSAYLAYVVLHAQHLWQEANAIAALSVEAFHCDISPFESLSHSIRRHQGQQLAATSIFDRIKDSQILSEEKVSVQDPYSFRCIPQVHGATWTAIEHAKSIIEEEINAVTDNPNIFYKEDRIISAGNFHAQPLAMVMDYLSIALSELGSISERRTYKLINGERDLPPYLIKNPGLESGFMIAQYTAASIASQNKHLANPASTDSLVSSMGQEDHVSMAANAGTKAYRLIQNVYRLLAIELMVGAKALEFRFPLQPGSHTQDLYTSYRKVVSSMEHDRILHDDLIKSEDFLRSRV